MKYFVTTNATWSDYYEMFLVLVTYQKIIKMYLFEIQRLAKKNLYVQING